LGLSPADTIRVGKVEQADVLALFPELQKRIDVLGGLLSGGEQQMLTLGRALARKPKILLADELSLGLASLVVTRLLDAVRTAAHRDGTAVLLVEQHVSKVLRYADRVYVMRRGKIVMSGDGADMRSRIDELEAAYLRSSQSDE
jgi:branched-chain amino acid transport system ATP-binding protein